MKEHPELTGAFTRRPALFALAVLVALAGTVWVARTAFSLVPLAGKKIVLKTGKGPQTQKFLFKTSKQGAITGAAHDPRAEGAALLVRGTGAAAGRSGLITLASDLWKPIGKGSRIKGYKYADRQATHGGVRKVVLKDRILSIAAKGENWPWNPSDAQESVWVHFRVGDEWYCAEFGGDNSKIRKNGAGLFVAKKSAAPAACPDRVCGNGVREADEGCDDGDLDDTNGCQSDCTCQEGKTFVATFAAIQDVIFDNAGYGCTVGGCHDSMSHRGSLDLTAGNAYSELVGVSSVKGQDKRVEPGDPEHSSLYTSVAARTLGTPAGEVPQMPASLFDALTPEHLEALRLWIQDGAPQQSVVEGTAELLGVCFP